MLAAVAVPAASSYEAAALLGQVAAQEVSQWLLSALGRARRSSSRHGSDKHMQLSSSVLAAGAGWWTADCCQALYLLCVVTNFLLSSKLQDK
jgi:hypothetical protein